MLGVLSCCVLDGLLRHHIGELVVEREIVPQKLAHLRAVRQSAELFFDSRDLTHEGPHVQQLVYANEGSHLAASLAFANPFAPSLHVVLHVRVCDPSHLTHYGWHRRSSQEKRGENTELRHEGIILRILRERTTGKYAWARHRAGARRRAARATVTEAG